jgi:hypothetical protein
MIFESQLKLAQRIDQFAFYIILSLGNLLCLLSTMIYYKHMFNGSSTKLMSVLFSVSGLVSLNISALSYYTMLNYSLYYVCNVLFFLKSLFTGWNSLCISLLTIDRYLQVKRKHRNIFDSKWFLVTINALFFASLALINIPNLFIGESSIKPLNKSDSSYFYLECSSYSRYTLLVFDLIEVVVNLCVSFASMVVSNALITRELINSRKKSNTTLKKSEYGGTIVITFGILMGLVLYAPSILVRLRKHYYGLYKDESVYLLESVANVFKMLFFIFPCIFNLMCNSAFKEPIKYAFQKLSIANSNTS